MCKVDLIPSTCLLEIITDYHSAHLLIYGGHLSIEFYEQNSYSKCPHEWEHLRVLWGVIAVGASKKNKGLNGA